MAGPESKLWAIITAAGASTRMAGPHKATLDWGGIPLLRHQCAVLQECGFTVVVVLGARAEEVRPTLAGLEGLRVLNNPDWERGRSSSLEVAAAAVPATVRWLLVAAVDQPLSVDNLKLLAHAASKHPNANLIVPSGPDGRTGHPLMLGTLVWPRLTTANEYPEGLRSVTSPHWADAIVVPCPEPVRLDLNTPEAYRSAR